MKKFTYLAQETHLFLSLTLTCDLFSRVSKSIFSLTLTYDLFSRVPKSIFSLTLTNDLFSRVSESIFSLILTCDLFSRVSKSIFFITDLDLWPVFSKSIFLTLTLTYNLFSRVSQCIKFKIIGSLSVSDILYNLSFLNIQIKILLHTARSILKRKNRSRSYSQVF